MLAISWGRTGFTEADQDATTLGVSEMHRLLEGGTTGGLGCRAGGQIKPADRAMAGRSAQTAWNGCSSCFEEERDDTMRFMRRAYYFQKDLLKTL